MTERVPDQLSFPKGRMAVYGQNAINPDATRSEAAATTARINQSDSLEAIITNPQRILISTATESGTHLAVLRPTGPYTNRAVMAAMYNKELRHNHETQWVYDYSEVDQKNYWKIVVAGLHCGRQILEEEGRTGVVTNLYAENSTHVSDISQRTSRTIKFPHGHLIEIDPEEIHPTTSVLHHLQEEQDTLERRKLVERFGVRVLQRMPNYGSDLFMQLDVRQSAPFGYQFSLDGDFDLANIEKLAKTLAEHHEAFIEVCELTMHAANRAFSTGREFKEKLGKVIRIPSYRLYLALNGEKLDVIVSPEFWSHGGVLEAADITLDRSEDHKQFPEEERLDFEGKFAQKVNDLISGLDSKAGKE